MPKVKYGPDVIEVTGSVYETTYDKCRKGGTFFRQRRRTHREIKSCATQSIRDSVTGASKFWKAILTESERNQWNAQSPAKMSGFNYYIAIQTLLISAGHLFWTFTPPVLSLAPTPPDIYLAWIDYELGGVYVFFNPPADCDPTAQVRVWAKSLKTLYQRQIVATALQDAGYVSFTTWPGTSGRKTPTTVPIKFQFQADTVNPDGAKSNFTSWLTNIDSVGLNLIVTQDMSPVVDVTGAYVVT